MESFKKEALIWEELEELEELVDYLEYGSEKPFSWHLTPLWSVINSNCQGRGKEEFHELLLDDHMANHLLRVANGLVLKSKKRLEWAKNGLQAAQEDLWKLEAILKKRGVQ